MTSVITKGNVKFSEKIGLDVLESLDGFQLDEILYNQEGVCSYPCTAMDEFRNNVPNATKFTVFFTFKSESPGYCLYCVEVEDNKFDKIEVEDTDMDDLGKVRQATNTLSKDLKLAVVKLKDTKEALTPTDEPAAEIDLF